jgi:hypothetical protein
MEKEEVLAETKQNNSLNYFFSHNLMSLSWSSNNVLLWSTKIYYPLHKDPPLDFIWSQLNPVVILPCNFSWIVLFQAGVGLFNTNLLTILDYYSSNWERVKHLWIGGPRPGNGTRRTRVRVSGFTTEPSFSGETGVLPSSNVWLDEGQNLSNGKPTELIRKHTVFQQVTATSSIYATH